MRVIPAQIDTGFSSNLRAFWLVKIEASGGIIKYWTSTSKNNDGNTLILKETSVGAVLTYDSTMIAAKDVSTGDEYDGVGAMESSVDMYSGGGIGSVSDLTIDILNHDRFDRTIISEVINIENRPITIYFGFLPAGANPTVLIQTEMLKRWAGIVEDVNEFNYTEFVLRCVDGSFQRHRDIPRTIIEIKTYPDAPEENVGKPIPILYGSFQENDINVARDFARLSLPPTIKTNGTTNEFYIADHEIHTLGDVYTWAELLHVFGKILTLPTATNNSSGARFSWLNEYASDIISSFIFQPKIAISIAGANGQNAIDDSETSFAHVKLSQFPQKWFVLQIPRQSDEGIPTSLLGYGSPELNFYVRFGAVNATEISVAQYNIGAGDVDVGIFTNADANTRKKFNFVIANLTWEQIGNMRVSVDTAAGGGGLECEVKNFAIELYLKMANIFYGVPISTGWK